HVVPPYSLPWQLRPVLPVTMIRSDTSLAFYGVNGFTAASFISGSYKIIPQVGVFAKLGVASDSPPTDTGGFTFGNPIIGGAFGFWPAKSMKLGATLGLALPIGSGGSLSNDPGAREANRAAMFARSGFDNPVFMPDYFSVMPGVDFAIVTHNLTLQAELNLVFLAKVRGQQQEKSAHQDMSMGLHAGYFFFPFLSAGVDFRYQYWLSKAYVVPQDPASTVITQDPTGYSRDNLTIAVGPRFHVQLSEELWLRPGISMAFGLDHPMSSSHYKIVQLDLPFFF
ncbi:MAG TPA: hypothetical protein VGQ57_19405, partial [Polyangiaceae bacterium]|nr:hypothetical protein [Polyangiaceae bacterium]